MCMHAVMHACSQCKFQVSRFTNTNRHSTPRPVLRTQVTEDKWFIEKFVSKNKLLLHFNEYMYIDTAIT